MMNLILITIFKLFLSCSIQVSTNKGRPVSKVIRKICKFQQVRDFVERQIVQHFNQKTMFFNLI
uniref:Secreted protein n=1 Tax=Tetranychus urticae TaxID=32264 RepID=T1KX78_TETUR